MLGIRRSYVVSLSRHHERLTRFFAESTEAINSAGIPAPIISEAIDGKLTGCPMGWVYRNVNPDFYRGLGAWGCYRSHLHIIESLLCRKNFDATLILEDDAFFIPDFIEQVADFVHQVPDDWDSIYLGGEHLFKPMPVGNLTSVVRCVMANRSHAYIVRGEQFLRALYERLADWRTWPNVWYADHAMGNLQVAGRWNVYAPTNWLVGQRGGISECDLHQSQDRIWNPKEEIKV